MSPELRAEPAESREASHRSLGQISQNAAALALSTLAVLGPMSEQPALASAEKPMHTSKGQAFYPPIIQPRQPAAINGISDQRIELWAPEEFQAVRDLNIKKARLVMRWDTMNRPNELAKVKSWLSSVQQHSLEPLISPGFNNPHGSEQNVPTPKQYRTAMTSFVKTHPSVRRYTVFNEAGQYGRIKPELAARYYKDLSAVVPRGSIVASGDFNNVNRLKNFIPRYFRELDRLRCTPKVFALHFDQGKLPVYDVLNLIPKRTIRGKKRPKMYLWISEGPAYAGQGSNSQINNVQRLLALPASEKFAYQLRYPNPTPSLSNTITGRTDDSAYLNFDFTPRPVFNLVRKAAIEKSQAAKKARTQSNNHLLSEKYSRPCKKVTSKTR